MGTLSNVSLQERLKERACYMQTDTVEIVLDKQWHPASSGPRLFDGSQWMSPETMKATGPGRIYHYETHFLLEK